MESKPRYNDLKKIEGHKNYYRNGISKKITFQRRGVRISTGLTQITKAKEFVELELARLSGTTQTTAAKRIKGVSNPLIKDAWDAMIDEKKVDWRGSTQRTYNKNWNVGLKGFWDGKNAQDITPANLTAYKAWYLENHPGRQFKKNMIHIETFLKWMHAKKFLGAIPDLSGLQSLVDLIEKNAKREKVGRRLAMTELAAIEEAAAGFNATNANGTTTEHKELLAARVQLGIGLGWRCGLRKMEALSLPWDKIDFERGLIHVWSQKNHKWRKVPMVSQTRIFFENQRAFTGHTKWVFPMPTDPDRFISGQVFDKLWIQVKKKAKVVGRLRFHDLRHTCASITADDGWPWKAACEMLDMSGDIYDRVYAKASIEKIAEFAVKSFGGVA